MTTQNNNELIDKLIYDQNTERGSASSVLPESEWEVLITTSRVVNIRYKIYVIILMILIGFFLYDYVQPAYDQYIATNAQIENITLDINNFGTKKLQYEKDKKLVTTINQQENQIISCLNYRIGCNELDPIVKDNFDIARSYIQIWDLSSSRMLVDEKKILANINEYLTKELSSEPGVKSRSKNGTLNSITIGDPLPGSGNLSSVPINLSVSFVDKASFLSFIDNIEKNVLDDPEYRILYKLDQVSYDIVNYESAQTVGILMHAYYSK